MKRTLACLLALLLALSLFAGCGETAQQATPQDTTNTANAGSTAATGGNSAATGTFESDSSTIEGDEDEIAQLLNNTDTMELTVGILNDVGSFYPGGSGTSGTKTKRVMLYETLFWKDPDGVYHPLLAKDYESLGSGSYAFELFDYIYGRAAGAVPSGDLYQRRDVRHLLLRHMGERGARTVSPLRLDDGPERHTGGGERRHSDHFQF